MKALILKLGLIVIYVMINISTQAQAPFVIELVKDINPTGDSRCGGFLELNGLVYFVADDGVHGTELWVSDGTEMGTYMVKDINPSDKGNIFDFQVLNGKLLFKAVDALHGGEWWVSDGTEAGTTLLKDINTLPPPSFESSTSIISIGMYNNELYFTANDGIHGLETWKTDGTTAGTQMVADLSPVPWSMAVAGSIIQINGMEYHDKFYYMANDSVHGFELWVLDSTNATPRMLKDIYPGEEDSRPFFLAVYNDVLLFRATDTNGPELWVTDGTAQGTQLMADIVTGPSGNIDQGSKPFGPLVYKDWLYFGTSIPGVGRHFLYRTQGVVGDPEEVILNSQPIWTGNGRSYVYNDKLYFNGYTDSTATELWCYTGSPGSDSLLIDIDTSTIWSFGGTLSSSPSHFFEFKEHLFFKAFVYSGFGNQIWVTNKEHDWFTYLTSNTTMMYDQSGFADKLIMGDYVYFQGNHDGYGEELWRIRYDSTLLGTGNDLVYLNKTLKAFPNPSKEGEVQLSFTLPESGTYSIRVYNLSGQVVRTVPEQSGLAGENILEMDLENLNSGVYIIELRSKSSFGQIKFVQM